MTVGYSGSDVVQVCGGGLDGGLGEGLGGGCCWQAGGSCGNQGAVLPAWLCPAVRLVLTSRLPACLPRLPAPPACPALPHRCRRTCASCASSRWPTTAASHTSGACPACCGVHLVAGAVAPRLCWCLPAPARPFAAAARPHPTFTSTHTRRRTCTQHSPALPFLPPGLQVGLCDPVWGTV